MGSGRIPYLTSRLQGFGTTIFAEMTRIANQHGAVNLGQGFPDFEGPAEIRDAAIAAILEGHNQYSRSFGIPELNAAIAAHQRRFYGLEYDPESEITVFHGATEAIASSLQAFASAIRCPARFPLSTEDTYCGSSGRRSAVSYQFRKCPR